MYKLKREERKMAKKIIILMIFSFGICLASSFSSICMADDGEHNDKVLIIKSQQAKGSSANNTTSYDGVDGESKSRKVLKGTKVRSIKGAKSYDGFDGESKLPKKIHLKKTGE
jgi:hypothetical protein